MTLNELVIVGLILLTIVCCLSIYSAALRRRSADEQFSPVLEDITRGEQWPYDLPGLQTEKQSWQPTPADLKDPIDSRD